MTDLRTISPDELPELSEIPGDLRLISFSPAGPMQAVPHDRLLSKLVGANLSKASKAALDADLAHPADSVALVFNDPAAANNGWYRKLGAAGTGSWQQFEELARNSRILAQAAATVAQEAAASVTGAVAAVNTAGAAQVAAINTAGAAQVALATAQANAAAASAASISLAGIMPQAVDLPVEDEIVGNELITILADRGAPKTISLFSLISYLNSYPSEPPPIVAPADFIVTNDAQWDAVFANSAAALVGKIVEVAAPSSAFTPRTIANKDVWTAGGRLTIRSANSGSGIPALTLSGTVRAIDFSGLNFQMRGWPRLQRGCVYFDNGTFGKLRFLNGTTFRHGYSASLLDYDTDFQYPEYDRIDNLQTATTVSATYPLTWKDTTTPGLTGWIEFFNNGANGVRVAVGGAGVVATTGSPLVPAGGRLRISTDVTPTTTTHFAVLAVAGTSAVNARTEIGLTQYLADAFISSGTAVVEDVEIRNCVFRDLGSAIKGFGPQNLIVMDCDFDRIYQDIAAPSLRPGGTAYYLRNLECIPFSRAGIAATLNGDARDPHGDQYQSFGDGSGTLGPIYYAGNRIRVGALRAGVNQQGIFLSDNDITPSYNNIFIISTMQVGGSSRALDVGEAGFPARNVMVYGASVVAWDDAASTAPAVSFVTDQPDSIYIGSTIARNITSGLLEDGVVRLSGVASPAAVFPNLGNLTTATTRAQIEAAITTAAEGAGLGAAATANAIDWTTTDHTAVIRWENVPSGVAWAALVNQAIASVITLPLRKVLNPRAAQAVSVGAGTEWRKVAADGVTELQAWTTSPGTIEPGQFIQIRRTSGGSLETVVASVTINGFTETVNITSAVSAPSAWLVMPATIAHLGDTAALPASTTRLTWRGKFFFPAGTISNGQALFSQVSNGCDLVTFGNGFTVTVEDGTQATVYSSGLSVIHAGKLVADTWLDIVFDVNQAAATITLTINGDTVTIPFTTPGNGLFNTARRIGFLATQAGALRMVANTRSADLSVDRNGSLYKSISNTAATANGDAWKLGAGVFTN